MQTQTAGPPRHRHFAATVEAITPHEAGSILKQRSLTSPAPPSVTRRAAQLEQLQETTGTDELSITTVIHDHADRVRSYQLLAGEWQRRCMSQGPGLLDCCPIDAGRTGRGGGQPANVRVTGTGLAKRSRTGQC